MSLSMALMLMFGVNIIHTNIVEAPISALSSGGGGGDYSGRPELPD